MSDGVYHHTYVTNSVLTANLILDHCPDLLSFEGFMPNAILHWLLCCMTDMYARFDLLLAQDSELYK